MNQPWLGLDIGGANLKAAHTSQWSASIAFPMWKAWKTLAVAIAGLIEACPPFHGVAVTMTGELADCFPTRAAGVASILEQVTAIVPSPMVRVYCVDGQWRTPAQAAREPWKAAASNWHALARWAAENTNQLPSVLIDVGSTTTDIVRIEKSGPLTDSETDSQRLQSGELVYTGIERSNLAGVVSSVPLFGNSCPVMNELFATTRDVYLWLELLPENEDDCDTADGKQATRNGARYRLARLVGEDGSTLADADIDEIAEHVFTAQSSRIESALQRVIALPIASGKKNSVKSFTPKSFILSGHGDFLVERALAPHFQHVDIIRLADTLGVELSRSAPAFAVASLAAKSF